MNKLYSFSEKDNKQQNKLGRKTQFGVPLQVSDAHEEVERLLIGEPGDFDPLADEEVDGNGIPVFGFLPLRGSRRSGSMDECESD